MTTITITLPRATVEQALEALLKSHTCPLLPDDCEAAITALKAALAQQAEPDAYGYASYLAVAIWEKYYKDTAPHWKPLDDLVGVLTQIDNMTSGLTRLAQQAEPVDARAFPQAGSGLSEEQVAGRIAARAQAKLARNYELADSIRAELAAQGIELKDGTQGTTWVRAPTPSMDEITRLRAERDALAERLREVRALLADTTDAHRKKVVMNAWAEQRLARHGIPMPEGDPK